MNNLGGYKSIELIFADELSVFSPTRNRVMIQKKDNSSRMLPLHDDSAALSATPVNNDAGILYTHQCTIFLRVLSLSTELCTLLRQVNVHGCILLAPTNNGNMRVFGSKEYPLLGHYAEEYGSKRSDLHQIKLSLTSQCLHGELEPL